MTKDRPKAKVDGKEIPIEIIEEGQERIRGEEPGANTTMPKWKLYLPIIVGGSILLLVAFVSISLFVWALPVILPLFLIWMIIRWIQKV